MRLEIRTRCAALAIAALAGSALPALGQDAAWDQTVAAAKTEGKVVLYTSDVATKCGPARAKAFQDKYGIEVQTLAARGTEVDERVRVEQAAGRYLGDVYVNGGAAVYNKVKEGALAPHGALPNLTHILPGRADADGIQLILQENPLGFVVSTEIPPAERPKRWTDLLDPKWKDKIVTDDVRVQGSPLGTFEALYNLYGRQYWEKMAAQNPVIDRDVGKSLRSIAAGQYMIGLTVSSAFFGAGAGLPIEFVLPQDGSPINLNGGSLLKNAPHPNAARLLLNYYLDADRQADCANEGGKPVVDDATAKLTPFALALSKQKALDHLDFEADRIAYWSKTAKEILK